MLARTSSDVCAAGHAGRRAALARGGPKAHVSRWLIIGACGRLGSHVLVAPESTGAVCLGVGRRACTAAHGPVVGLDLTRLTSLSDLLETFAPTRTLHLAGITSPSHAVRNVALTWQLNYTVTAQLARHARRTGAHMLSAYSDFVCSGEAERPYRERDRPSASGPYALRKIAAERLVLACDVGVVARYSYMYGLPRCPRGTLACTRSSSSRTTRRRWEAAFVRCARSYPKAASRRASWMCPRAARLPQCCAGSSLRWMCSRPSATAASRRPATRARFAGHRTRG